MTTICKAPVESDILNRMKPRENTERFAMLIDRDLKRDLIEVQHRLRLRSVTDVIHLYLKRAVDKELGRKPATPKKGE